MTPADRVLRRFLARDHQVLLQDLSKLLAGPKLSDSRLCQQLGISLTEAHHLVQELRKMHGLTSMDNLRDYLRKHRTS